MTAFVDLVLRALAMLLAGTSPTPASPPPPAPAAIVATTATQARPAPARPTATVPAVRPAKVTATVPSPAAPPPPAVTTTTVPTLATVTPPPAAAVLGDYSAVVRQSKALAPLPGSSDSRWAATVRTLTPVDVTPDGSLRAVIDEEAGYWNRAGAAIRWAPAAWVPGGSCNQDNPSTTVPFCSAATAPEYGQASPATTGPGTPITSAHLTVCGDCGLDARQLRVTVGHEMGHVLGLGHLPGDPASVMFPTCAATYGAPDAQDLADLRGLYPAAA